MLVKYAMKTANFSLANFQADMAGLIAGTITTVSGLSSSCDKTETTITGSYPSGSLYAVENSGTFTFSKKHHLYPTDATATTYFRFTYTGNAITAIVQARSYTSGTDTLVNSYSNTVAITATPYYVNDPFTTKLWIFIGSEGIFFYSKADYMNNGSVNCLTLVGIADITRTELGAYLTTSASSCFIDLNKVGVGSLYQTIPYWATQTANGAPTYASKTVTPSYVNSATYTDASGNYLVVENPFYFTPTEQFSQPVYMFGATYIGSVPTTVIPYESTFNSSTRVRLNPNNYISVKIN